MTNLCADKPAEKGSPCPQCRLQDRLDHLTRDMQRLREERIRERHESEARLNLALEGAREGLWVIDFVQDKMIFNVNSARMLGYTLDELGSTSARWDNITHPEDWPRVEKSLQDHFKGLTPHYEAEYRARTKEGRWKWILGHGRVTQRDAGGNPLQAIGTHVDITKLKETEIRLRRSEDKFKALVENAPLGLLILGQDRRIEYFNPRFVEIFGYSREDIPDLDHWLQKAYPHSNYRRKAMAVWEEIFSSTGDIRECEPMQYTVRCKDGRRKVINFRHVVLKDRKNLVSYEDVTARAEAEKALKLRERELEIKTEKLEEMNHALRVLLQRIEQDKTELEEKVQLNMKDLVLPYLSKLEKSRLSERQRIYMDILRSNLNDIVSPFSRKLAASHLYLTPKEIQVANLIKGDHQTKEISEVLGTSQSAVQFHRHNIRKKLGLVDQKINLKSYLQTL